ncbi:MAG: hypothetical protein ACSHX4_14675 [Opitutaceae bacterium]
MNAQPNTKYKAPLAIVFVWHPEDADVAKPLYDACIELLSRDSNRPFSRSLNIPVFHQTSEGDEPPAHLELNAEITLYMPFLSMNVVGCENWRPYAESIPLDAENKIIPIGLDDTSYNTQGNVEGLNFIRASDYLGDLKNQNLILSILHEIYRHALNESAEELTLGTESAIVIFLSHAKDAGCGLALAQALKVIIDKGKFNNFFDANDIGAGKAFDSEILGNIRKSTIVAIHSDIYSSRYWCQREIISAKVENRPIVAIDLIDEYEDRRFPNGSNIPCLRVPCQEDLTFDDSILLKILTFAILETIRYNYSKLLLKQAQVAGWFPSKAFLSSRPPEASSYNLARNASSAALTDNIDFVYPEPPIYAEELDHLKEYNCNAYTPLTYESESLVGLKIGISISNPNPENLDTVGQHKAYHGLLAQDLGRHILARGGNLIYGGDFRDDGITKFLVTEAQALKDRTKATNILIQNYVAWPIHLKEKATTKQWIAYYHDVAEFIRRECSEGLSDLVKDPSISIDSDSAENLFVWAQNLSSMRAEMIGNCDIRISAAGKHVGFLSCMPGVLEEISIAITTNKPLFLAGGFGGVTGSVCRMIETESCPEELTLDWQMHNNPNLKDMYDYAKTRGIDYYALYESALAGIAGLTFANGLSVEENTRLMKTQFIDEALHLILKGLKNLKN